MKNAPLYRRILSVTLAVAMLFSLLVPAVSAEKAAAASRVEELELVPVDPGTLESLKVKFPSEDTTVNMEDHKLSDVVRVSIVLDKASTLEAGFRAEGVAKNAAAKAYREGLRADQAAMTAKIEQAIGGKLDVQWNLTLAANIISANVLYGQIDTIKSISGIRSVFLENRYEPEKGVEEDKPNNGSASVMIGSNISWAAGYTGAGSKVAVIDTGIDKDHLSFSGEALEYALQKNAEEKGISYEEYVASLNLLTAESIDAVKDQLNANIGSGEKVHISTKIGYGYNYVDKGFDVTHLGDSQGEHGSHVEGISAANRFVKVDGEFKPALEAVGTQGVAPDAQIVTMKVFGAAGGAYDSDYMVAIEDAIILGCDSANLSLGSGSAGMGFSAGYQEVMDKLVQNAMVCSISAGNAYSWYNTPKNLQYPYIYADDAHYDTVGSPGSFTNALTVASVDNAGKTGMPLLFGDKSVFYNETSGYGNTPIATLSGSDLEYVIINSPGVDDNNHVGQAGDDFMALGSEILTGKVAMCFRGTSSFFAKANAAVAQGAIAVIIINNQPGAINMNLTGYNYTAPAVSIMQDDGLAVIADSQENTSESGITYYTGTMRVGEDLEIYAPEPSDTVTVSSFSSWGVPGTLVMKPEILAPGGSIYSVWGANKSSDSPTDAHDQYELMSGTSMAAPQVNGMAGVLGQYIRDNGLCEKTGLTQRQLINSLLMSTAHPVYDADGNYYPLLQVGAGLANVGDAVNAKSYILMDEDSTLFPDTAKDGKVKAELGDDPDFTGDYTYSFTVYPLEGKKEFTLRTDVFVQWLAGNAGYGVLQDTATTLIGSVATYEVDGETYEDSYLIEADVNMDGVTDEADAQAILDKLTGKLGEDEKFDEAAADVDGDKKITSFDAKLILDSAATPTIEVSAPTHVTVHLKLDEGDKAFLLNYFTNGFYVQGYTYVEPVADEEGAMDVVHSIPVFGYCGSWTDPAMLDRTSAIDEAYGTGKLPYVGTGSFNYMTLKDADGNTAIYMGNPFTVEETFPAEKLAMNGESTVAAFNYLNIRNVATLGFAIQDEEGKVIFAQATPIAKAGAYYYVNGGSWQNTGASNYNVGKKLSSAGLQEGDKVTVGFYALPEYYAIVNAKLNGEVAASGNLDTAGFKNVLEAGIVGDGAGMKYTVTIDNTAPEVLGAFRDLITGNITVKAKDNAYIAYVGVMNKSGTKEFFGTVPEQDEPGTEIEVPLDLEGQQLPNEVTLLVGDYAGNKAAFKVQLGGSEQEAEPIMLGFVPAGTTAAPGSGNRAWEIDRENVSYNHSAGVYTGLSVYGSTPVAVKAAEYVEGYVFMAGDDGWFYAADINALDEAARVGKYDAVTAQIFDMAFNYKNHKLYVLGADNTIYTMDLITGELTPVVILELNTVDGTYKVANKLAIDDEGVAYVANYGGPSYAKLFKFELPEEEEEEEEEDSPALVTFDFETDPLEAGWNFIDKDADAHNWTWDTAASPVANDGTGKIVSASFEGGARTPNNWAVSPAIDITGATDLKLSIFAKNYSTTYPDTIALYAGTTADPDAMTKVSDDIQPDGDWNNYVADLSAFEGETELYVAVRHYNCTDMWKVYVDTVSVLGTVGESEEPSEPEPVEIPTLAVDPVGGTMGVYNYSNGGALAWDHNEDVLYLAANYSKTQDYDHYLWLLNTETGKATKANTSNGSYSARLYGNVCGLLIVPVETTTIKPTDEATELVVEPESLTILKGQTVEAKAAAFPWTLTDKEVTWESADETIATVKDGMITGVEVGETKIIVTTVAAPNLTAEISVTVQAPPEVTLRGIIWDEDGKGQASVFNTTAPQDWEAQAVVGQLRWGALVGDMVYGSTDDTLIGFDADTYEVETYGGIVSMWIPSDAAELPEDFIEAFAAMGYEVGPVIGPNNGGTYLTMFNIESGQLLYFNLGTTVFGSDPLVTFAIAGRGVYDDGEDTDDNAVIYYGLTESGDLYRFALNHAGSIQWEEVGLTGLDLSGVSDSTNSIWASMHYDEESGFLFLTHYDGADDYAYLYAIDAEDPTCNAKVGNFNADVWPVTGLYAYEPATDLVLQVKPTDVVLFEGETAELKVKVKLGETNEYTFEVADESVCTFADGVITAVKEGTTTITFTTVDTNEAGEHLTETVNVKVKGFKSVEAFVTGQVTDAKGTRFTKISLDGAVVSNKGVDAPGNLTSGGRAGDIYFAGIGTAFDILDAETFEPTTEWAGVDTATYPSYPALDVANYPVFTDADGAVDDSRMLFTTSVGWLVNPQYSGWNLSSLVPNMSGVCFGGTDDLGGTPVYVYYILDTDGILYQIDIDYTNGRRTDPQKLLETGIKLGAAGDASMAFITTANVHGDMDVELGEQGIVIADNGTKKLWYLDFTAENLEDVVCLIGIMDVENVSGLIGSFDDLAAIGEAEVPEPEPDPYEDAEVVASFDFENDPATEGFTFVDADGDNYGWVWNKNMASWFSGDVDLDSMAYMGTGCVASASYINTYGELTPDNWIVFPAVDLSEVANPVFGVYAAGSDPSYAAENFAIYAGTSANTAEMVKISDDITTTGNWTRYYADLADFAGQSEVYVALRHYNISDMYILLADEAEVIDVTESDPGAVKTYEAVKLAAAPAALELGAARADVALVETSREMSKLGETANAVTGTTNAIKGVAFTEAKRQVVDDTAVEAGTVKVDLCDDVAVTNGLYEITYDPEVLTFVNAASELEFHSVNEDEGTILFAFASAEEIEAETVLATLNFTYEGEEVDTVVTVKVHERDDDVAVDETLEIPVKVEKPEEHDCPCAMFEDMPEYGTIEHAAIDWAYTHTPVQITDGMDDTHFMPDFIVNRGQAVTFLYRAAGEPEVSGTNPFTDLTQDWYKAPINWAYNADPQITDGMTDTTFEPDTKLNKAMMLTFLYRQQGKPDVAESDAFADVPVWYRDAMLWALQKGIITEDTVWSDDCPRVDVVVYLFRVYEPEAAAAFD